MKSCVGLLLLVCCVTHSLGRTRSSAGNSAIKCYKCENYSGARCSEHEVCRFEDACLYLYEKGGKTIRNCIRYTDCDNSRLSQKYPSISEYTYRCCNTDLCNGAPVTAARASLLSLLAPLTGIWCYYGLTA